MERALQLEIARLLQATLEVSDPTECKERRELEVPAHHYTSEEHLAIERARLFRACPVLAAHSQHLPEPGDSMTHDATGLPVILVRGKDGVVRGFVNACRHRATRLLDCDAPCQRKAFVCRYHGWTYDQQGALVHVPHQSAFPTLDTGARGLLPVPVAEAHGFIWLLADPGADLDLAGYLGPVGAELDSFGMAEHTLYRESARECACNWKLVMDAFLEGYHVRHLHRSSVYPFFYDSRGAAQSVGQHIRTASARRLLGDADLDDPTLVVRSLVSFTHFVFPNTVFIYHPDYISRLSVYPLAADRTRFEHTMLIPEAPTNDKAARHWTRSFDLIQDSVFEAEDLAVCVAMQRGLASGVTGPLLFGALEHPAQWFHHTLAEYGAG